MKMEYKYYKSDDFQPFWFKVQNTPKQYLDFLDALACPFVLKGGYAVSKYINNPEFKTKDIDLITTKDHLYGLLATKNTQWQYFLNKNISGLDVLTLFQPYKEATLKIDILLLAALPKIQNIKGGYPTVSVMWLILDKLKKLSSADSRLITKEKIERTSLITEQLLMVILSEPDIIKVDIDATLDFIKIPESNLVGTGKVLDLVQQCKVICREVL